MRQSFQEYAQQSIKWSAWAKLYYQQQRQKGSSQAQAVRSLAYKWIRIIYRCWKEEVRYDEQVYLEALKRRGSPFAEAIEEAKRGRDEEGVSKSRPFREGSVKTPASPLSEKRWASPKKD